MGLDLVELVLGTEEAFGIAIPDSDAVSLETPRLLINYVEKRLNAGNDSGCLGQRAFYILREELGGQLVSRANVKPSTRWDELLSKRERIRVWPRLTARLGSGKLPELTRPQFIAWGILLSSAVLGIALWNSAETATQLLVAPVATVGFAHLALWVTRSARFVVPDKIATVGAAAVHLAKHAPAAVKGSRAKWTRREIEQTVEELIKYHLGISSFRYDDHFVRDLGAG